MGFQRVWSSGETWDLMPFPTETSLWVLFVFAYLRKFVCAYACSDHGFRDRTSSPGDELQAVVAAANRTLVLMRAKPVLTR